MKRIAVLILVFASIALFIFFTKRKEGFVSRTRGVFQTAKGPVEVDLEVAENPEEIKQGLMNRTSLPPKTGMLFVFPDEAERGFWMRNTLIPLDMIFINAAGYIINIEHSATPKTDTLRASKGLAQYVVELPGDTAHAYAIKAGDRFTANL
jgi:uncharacterized membrane protein (UPF0127 family)